MQRKTRRTSEFACVSRGHFSACVQNPDLHPHPANALSAFSFPSRATDLPCAWVPVASSSRQRFRPQPTRSLAKDRIRSQRHPPFCTPLRGPLIQRSLSSTISAVLNQNHLGRPMTPVAPILNLDRSVPLIRCSLISTAALVSCRTCHRPLFIVIPVAVT